MSTVSTTETADQPKGIGGWLILPAIGTFIAPLFSLWSAYQTSLALSGTLQPNVRAVIVAEVLVNVVLAANWIFAIVALLRYRRYYPRLYVATIVATLVFAVADITAASVFFNLPFDADDAKTIGRPLVALLIWGPYMFNSKRVRNTFTT